MTRQEYEDIIQQCNLTICFVRYVKRGLEKHQDIYKAIGDLQDIICLEEQTRDEYRKEMKSCAN